MTDRELKRLAKQLRSGFEGFTTLLLAVEHAHIGDQPALERGIERMRRLREELREQSDYVQDPPRWLREVKL